MKFNGVVVTVMMLLTNFSHADAVTDLFVTKNLPNSDIFLLKSYIKEKSFQPFLYGYVGGATSQEEQNNRMKAMLENPPSPSPNYKEEAIQVDNLTQERLINHDFGKTYLGADCTAKFINNFYRDNNLKIKLPTDDDCYLYARKSVPGTLFKAGVNTTYYQVIDANVVTNNPMSCAKSGACSLKDSKDIMPADLVDAYNTLLEYSRKCKTQDCKIDIGLIAYNKDLFKYTVNEWAIPPENEPIITPSKIILEAVSKNTLREHNETWELASAMYGQLNAFSCSINIQRQNGKLTEDSMDECMLELKFANTFNKINYNQKRYAEGLKDGYNVILKYKPNQSQSLDAYNLIQKYGAKFDARGELQGFF